MVLCGRIRATEKSPGVVYAEPLQQRPGHQGQQQLWSEASLCLQQDAGAGNYRDCPSPLELRRP